MEVSDLDILIEKGFYEMTGDPPRGIASLLFTVPEEGKERRRVVHDVLVANLFLPEPSPFEFSSTNQLVAKVLSEDSHFALVFDFAAFFWQIQLQKEVRPFFSTLTKRGWLRPTVLPMGFSWAVKIAQSVSQFVLKLSLERAQISPKFCDVYIDGLLICTETVAQADVMRRAVQSVCSEFNVQFSEDTGATTSPTFRGLEFDMQGHSFKLAKKFVAKFNARALRIVNGKGRWGDIRSVLSMISYATYVRQRPLAGIVSLLRMLVRNVSVHPNKILTIWPHCEIAWNAARKEICANESVFPCAVLTSPSRFVLISDAATEGARGGFFVIDRKTDAIWAEECAFAPAKIAVLEAQAMERGFEAVCEKAAFGDAVEIWTDNTCVKALLIRRFCARSSTS